MHHDHAETIVGLMMELNRAIKHRVRCVRPLAPLNMLQLHALAYIGEHDGITMKQLADYLQISSPSTTVFVARLMRLKLVRRRTDVSNRTLVRLFMTTAGKNVWESAMREFRGVLKQIFEQVPADDQRDLVRILSSLVPSIRPGASR